MFCSGCGQPIGAGQTVCAACGRPLAPAIPMPPPVPGFEFDVERYAAKVRTLGILWIVYAGLSLAMGFAGLQFAKHFMDGGMGSWMQGQNVPVWVFPAAIHMAWIFLSLRAVLCAVAGWGLLEHREWGRILAIIVAVLTLIKFPIGTAIGIATLVILLGYRNTTLYQQL